MPRTTSHLRRRHARGPYERSPSPSPQHANRSGVLATRLNDVLEGMDVQDEAEEREVEGNLEGQFNAVKTELARSESGISELTASSQVYWDQVEDFSSYPFGTQPIPGPVKGNNSAKSSSDTLVDPVNGGINPKISSDLSSGPLISGGADAQDYTIIAHSTDYQSQFESRELSFGVLWEIARLYTRKFMDYESIELSLLDKLKGTNQQAAPSVSKLLARRSKNGSSASAATVPNTDSLWAVIDQEEALLRDDPYSGHQSKNAVGTIHFTAVLSRKDKKSPYVVKLKAPFVGMSCRFARSYGSQRILRVSVTQTFSAEEAQEQKQCFSKPLIINGMVFRVFDAKSSTVFLARTNERMEGTRLISPPDDFTTADGRISISSFIERHNPMACNTEKTMCKWAARMALGLSNSVAGPQFDESEVNAIPDIISPAAQDPANPPSECQMTDGCGLMRIDVARQIMTQLGLDGPPSAVQMRFGGAKGLLVIDPVSLESAENAEVHEHQPPKLQLRPSQIKIWKPEGEPLGPESLVLEILRTSRLKTPARLSREVMINLEANGVPSDVFVKLLKNGMEDIWTSLTSWDGQFAMQQVFQYIMKNSCVMTGRLCRLLAAESRARGFGEPESVDEMDLEDEDDEDSPEEPPANLAEALLRRLGAGFHPKTDSLTARQIKNLLKVYMERAILKYHIDIPMSCEAFVIPDPTGTLKAGEIFVKSSRDLPGPLGTLVDVLEGPVLVTRHPCKVPTDVQKVTAVDCPELRRYKDVIVFSVHGDRSLASMLGGGDYDGDTVTVIWEPKIVQNFKNASLEYANPPHNLKDSFIKNTKTAGEFLAETDLLDSRARMNAIQSYLLAGLKDSGVGRYSVYHDVAVYERGYFDAETHRLGYMFCTCLDGSKTGLTVRPEVARKDAGAYERQPFPWSEEASRSIVPPDKKALKRKTGAPKFILERIADAGKKQLDEYLRRLQEMMEDGSVSRGMDEDLAKPWNDALARAGRMKRDEGYAGLQNELDAIKKLVECSRVQHRAAVHSYVGSPSSRTWAARKNAASPSKRGMQKDDSRDVQGWRTVMRPVAKAFMSGLGSPSCLGEQERRHIRASYAYIHDRTCTGRTTEFPWDVAFNDLCEIKASANGGLAPLRQDFYGLMKMDANVRKLF